MDGVYLTHHHHYRNFAVVVGSRKFAAPAVVAAQKHFAARALVLTGRPICSVLRYKKVLYKSLDEQQRNNNGALAALIRRFRHISEYHGQLRIDHRRYQQKNCRHLIVRCPQMRAIFDINDDGATKMLLVIAGLFLPKANARTPYVTGLQYKMLALNQKPSTSTFPFCRHRAKWPYHLRHRAFLIDIISYALSYRNGIFDMDNIISSHYNDARCARTYFRPGCHMYGRHIFTVYFGRDIF